MFPSCYEAKTLMRTALDYLKSLKVVTRREMLTILNNCSNRRNDCWDCKDQEECNQLYDKFFCQTEDVVVKKDAAKAQ